MVKNIRRSVPSDAYNDCSFVSNNLLDYIISEKVLFAASSLKIITLAHLIL